MSQTAATPSEAATRPPSRSAKTGTVAVRAAADFIKPGSAAAKMPSMTNARASAVAKSRIGLGFRSGLGGADAGRGEEAEELAVGRQHQRGVAAGERRPVGLERAVEREECLILPERLGIDADGVGIALAAQDLRVLLRLGQDLDPLPVGIGGDLARLAVAVGAELRRLALPVRFHAGEDRGAVVGRQVGAAD